MSTDDKKPDRHPSYVMASFSRVSGGDGNFFGTAVRPDHYITLKIMQAEKVIDWTGKEKFYADNSSIIEVKFTANQFAELITTMNVGEGVPGTVYRLGGKGVDACPPQTSKVLNVIRNATEKNQEILENAQETFNKVRDILENKKSISQADRDLIKKAILETGERVREGNSFYAKKINEVGESVKQEIKTEIDAMATHVIHGVGLSTIKNLALEDKNKK